eukprot:767809-Hanusia_phi.AAC.3
MKQEQEPGSKKSQVGAGGESEREGGGRCVRASCCTGSLQYIVPNLHPTLPPYPTLPYHTIPYRTGVVTKGRGGGQLADQVAGSLGYHREIGTGENIFTQLKIWSSISDHTVKWSAPSQSAAL